MCYTTVGEFNNNATINGNNVTELGKQYCRKCECTKVSHQWNKTYLGMTASSRLGCCGGERATGEGPLLFPGSGEASTSGGVAEDCSGTAVGGTTAAGGFWGGVLARSGSCWRELRSLTG